MLQEVCDGVVRTMQASGIDLLCHPPELAKYVCFAVDMHWHKAGAHDARHDAKKVSVGHSFSLNLHDHSLRHLAAAESDYEHDMSVMQRLKPKGQRVLVVYERAGIDFALLEALPTRERDLLPEPDEVEHVDRVGRPAPLGSCGPPIAGSCTINGERLAGDTGCA